MGPFTTHIVDAIKVNKRRRTLYGRRSGGRSRRVSDLLIWFEYGCVPFARWVDARAARWIAKGIPVVDADLMPMDAIEPWDAAPLYTGEAPREAFGALKRSLKQYGRALGAAMKRQPDFREAAAASMALLEEVEALEERTGSHFAMTRHFVESIGLAAANAVGYVERTGGELLPLCRRFVQIQAMGLPSVLPFDRLAQPIHALGLGILVNDVPAIPFHQAWPPGQDL
jgi:hypothetical protein